MAGVLAFIGAPPVRCEPPECEPPEEEDIVRRKKLAATVVRLLPCFEFGD